MEKPGDILPLFFQISAQWESRSRGVEKWRKYLEIKLILLPLVRAPSPAYDARSSPDDNTSSPVTCEFPPPLVVLAHVVHLSSRQLFPSLLDLESYGLHWPV